MRTDFEERRQARIERYQALSEKAERESDQRFEAVHRISDMIPMGQPILVGHHSERRHRRDLEKMDNNMRKSIELSEKAKYYEHRAESAASNDAIFSDDPNAAEKLADKIARLEQRQELMKKANACIRKKDIEGLKALGFSDSSVTKLFEPDFGGRVGFAGYLLTNNNANINRLKLRLKQQLTLESKETSEIEINGVKIVENVEANRLQMFFDGKPADSIRTELKRSGFRWSPREMAWQRHISNRAMYHAKRIVELLG